MNKIFILLLSLLEFSSLRAGEQQVLELDCHVISGGICTIVEGSKFVTVNGTGVPFYSRTGSTKNHATSQGSFSQKSLLVGDNLFEYSLSKGGVEKEYIKQSNTVKLLPDLEILSFIREGHYPATITGETTVRIGLGRIDPILAQRVLDEKKKFYSTNKEFARYSESGPDQITDLKKELSIAQSNYEQCFKIIKSTAWPDLRTDDFSQCSDAGDIFFKLKKELEKTNELLDGQKEIIKTILDNRADQIGKIVKKFDVPVRDEYEELNSLEEDNWDEYADSIIKELDDAYKSQRRDEFIIIAKNWNDTSRNILSQSSIALKSIRAIRKINQKVDSFIFSKVDQQFWFKDVQVSEQVKTSIEVDIARVNPQAATLIKSEVNKWGRPLTELERAQLQSLQGIAQAVRNTFMAGSNVFGVTKKLQVAISEMAMDISKGVVCVAGNTLLNDWGDAFELITGRDRCDFQKKKTPFERACSALGLLVGSGKVWENVVTDQKVIEDISIVNSKVDDLFLKDADELADFAKVLKSRGKLADDGLQGKLNSYASAKRYNFLNPGPLDLSKSGRYKIADTFRGSSYFQITLNEPVTLYRVYGTNKSGASNMLGAYWTRIKPTGPFQATIDSALNPEFGKLTGWAEITLPAGVEFFEGAAAPQLIQSQLGRNKLGELMGGGNQIYFNFDISKTISKWNLKTGHF